jgi:hypothetical protein
VNSDTAPFVQADNRAKGPMLNSTGYCSAEEGAAPRETLMTSDADTSQAGQYALDELRTPTQFGGVFYLINLGLYLGLYGDFTTPAQPGIALNIWDFVALVGRELIGEKVEDDPVWRLLARLAGRNDDDEPGGCFEPEDEWRLPAEWLKPFANENTVRWFSGDGRLRLLHSSGFLVLDVPLDAGNPAAQLERELKAYESFEFRVSSSESEFPIPEANRVLASEMKLETRNSELETASAIADWLGHLLPYIRSRLSRALGLKTAEALLPAWWQQKANICVTAAHLDIIFSLAELPIEIRLAGLDRNPGWVPAAGKFIEFHFE